ncbi:MAG: hypothetical protein M1457_11935 [bacterium]|nr:hypothetical protein [bacterium]
MRSQDSRSDCGAGRLVVHPIRVLIMVAILAFVAANLIPNLFGLPSQLLGRSPRIAMYTFFDFLGLAIGLLFGLLILGVVARLFLGVIHWLFRDGHPIANRAHFRPQDGSTNTDETRLLQTIARQMDRMEERVENLETILMERQRR